MPDWIANLLIFLVEIIVLISVLCGVVLAFWKLGKRNKPCFGLFGVNEPGSLGYWVDWSPQHGDLGVYRFKLLKISPESTEKEGQFTYSYDSPQSKPFSHIVQLPDGLLQLLSSPDQHAIITVEIRSTNENALFHDFPISRFRRIYKGAICWGGKNRATIINNQLPIGKVDKPVIASLDHEEIEQRKKRLLELAAMAKARAEKKNTPSSTKTAAGEADKQTSPPKDVEDKKNKPIEGGNKPEVAG